MKEKTNQEKEREQTRGKKRYRERLIEEKEAKQEIKEYDRGELVKENDHPKSILTKN